MNLKLSLKKPKLPRRDSNGENMKRIVAYIAMGSNVGGRAETLRQAVDILRRCEGVTLKRISTFIETQAVGGPVDQDDYLNGACEIETTLEPIELLDVLQDIEAKLGRDRQREQRWGPRTCDLDLLLYGDEIIDCERLTVPHPRMWQRRFVLEPLCEIAPDARCPETYRTVREILETLGDAE